MSGLRSPVNDGSACPYAPPTTSLIAIVLGVISLVGRPGVTLGQTTVAVQAVSSEASQPLVGALAYLVDQHGAVVGQALSDERGRVLFNQVIDGSYLVRMEMIGMETDSTDLFEVDRRGDAISRTIHLDSRPIQLEGLDVDARERCTLRPTGEGLAISRLWDDARKALATTAFTQAQNAYRYETMGYVREIDRDSGITLSEERTERAGYMRTPYMSRPTTELMEEGFVQEDRGDFTYYAPDASTLLSDLFLDTHCFRLEGLRQGTDDQIGLHFEPTQERGAVPDISGTMWLNRRTAELSYLEFTYEFLDPDFSVPGIGGRVDFQRLPDGTWIVPEWWIRMPMMVMTYDLTGQARLHVDRFRQTGGVVVDIHASGGENLSGRARTARIRGVVRDSLGNPAALIGVRVLGSNQEVFTNARGEFSTAQLASGSYRVGFIAPWLERMGQPPQTVERNVRPEGTAPIELRLPSVSEVFSDACGSASDLGAGLAGRVVDDVGVPVAGATVLVGWVRYGFQGVMIGRRPSDIRALDETLESRSNERGAFIFCGVPTGTTLAVVAYGSEATSEAHQFTIAADQAGDVRVLALTLPP